jgi:hypothetical protein
MAKRSAKIIEIKEMVGETGVVVQKLKFLNNSIVYI